MTKSLLLITFLIFLSSFIYASFPVYGMSIIHQDTLKSETILEYHTRMEKLGFDISLCKCSGCQVSSKVISSTPSKNYFTNSLLNVGLFLLTCLLVMGLVILYLIIKLVSNWLDDGAPFL